MSTVNVKYIKDEDGNIVSPVTSTTSVFDENGRDLVTLKTLNEISLDASLWSDTVPYTQSIETSFLTGNDVVNVYPVYSSDYETRKTEKTEYNKLSYVNNKARYFTILL